MDPTRVGTWIVIQPDGSERKLRLRFIDDGQQSFEHDSARDGWSNYGITLAAEQPFWEGEEISGSWESGSAVPFFGGTGGPAFTISPGNTLETAEILNPGDVPAYMVWRVEGPITAATVGVNGRNITLPFAISDGSVVEIDTRPNAQTAMKGDADNYGPDLTIDWTYKLGTIDFAPLPPGEMSTLTLSMTGAGRITATFVPLYYRAW